MLCNECQDLDEMEKEYPDEIHHGATIYCDTCGAEYYEAYGGERFVCNEIAQQNHLELKTL